MSSSGIRATVGGRAWQARWIESDATPTNNNPTAAPTSTAATAGAASASPSSAPPDPTRRPRRRFWSIVGALIGPLLTLLVVGLSAFSAFYTFPDVVIRPGSADSVGPRLDIEGVRNYPATGKVLWATVALVPEPRLLDMIDAWLHDDIDVQPKQKILGDATPEENRRISSEEMDDSKQTAMVVAARKLGYTADGGGVLIADVQPKSPADGVLRKNDVVVSADGRSLCLIGDLRTAITSHKPGETVHFVVRRGTDAPRNVDVVTAKASDGRAVIGVFAGSVKGSPCKIPFDVKIDTARIGGPSAGLAMTLALLDRLTKGELTGGVPVATTGTIEADGSVGPVGGVKQKTHAVKAAGAKLFIVPVDEVALARSVAGKMKVVGVRNLDEALQALRDLGGDPLPTPSKAASTSS